MDGRGVKIALVISVILNVFFIGAAISAAVFSERLVHHWMRPPPTPLSQASRALDPEVRVKLREAMRAEALAARADFVAAHDARLKAAELAAAPTFDRAAVKAQLDAARSDETRGHVRLEDKLLDVMQSLPADQRAKLAAALKGRPPRPRPDHGRDRPGERPAS